MIAGRAWLSAALAATLLLAPLHGSPQTPSAKWQSDVDLPAPEIDEAVRMLNAERTRRNLRALTLDARLVEAAAGHARDLADGGRLAHTGSDGSTTAQRIERAGFLWSKYAENLAASTAPLPVAEIVRKWMASPVHRTSILDPHFTHAGIARSGNVWVLDLASPR